jgi:hypothetical protein
VSIQDPVHKDIWRSFPDASNYVFQSKMDISTVEFWFPSFQLYLTPRPFSVPLLYKLAGSEPQQIICLQKVIHFLAGFLLSVSVGMFMRHKVLKFLVPLALCIIFCWWNILGWTQQLLSESLSFSFLFIWVSSLLIYTKFNRPGFLIFHIAITIIFSFTRDSWPAVLIVFYIMLSFVFYFYHNLKMNVSLLLFLMSVIIFNVQQNSVQKGERHRIPIFNNIAIRILNHPDYLEYFTNRGMPMAEELKADLLGVDLRENTNRGHLYDLYYSEKYKILHKWIVDNGRSVYLGFLMTHPSYLLMVREPQSNLKLFYERNLYSYTGTPLGISTVVDPLFPVISYVALFIFIILLSIINYQKKNVAHILFIVLYFTLVLNAILIYNADSLEINRHLFFNSIFVEVIGVVVLTFIFDNLRYLLPLKLRQRVFVEDEA